jgi:uncharacterized protein
MRNKPQEDADDVIRLVRSPSAIAAETWNALLATQTEPTPFMRHEYLAALHASGSAVAKSGWDPCFLLLEDAQQGLAAAMPVYAKAHSYGEYVFDWAWADAHERHGITYYPKLLCAVPFTPVPGTRILARDDASRRRLLTALRETARQSGLSSAHLLFLSEADEAAARESGWLMREAVQFHWTNRSPEPYTRFEEFLATLQRDKRKKIQQERRRVRDTGVHFTSHAGNDIESSMWDFFYRCYTLTYRAHHSTPYLTRDFFRRMAATMPATWRMFVAHREGQPIAASLIAVDDERRVAFGRYWGCIESIPCLHFEACYYQPLQWCIEQRYARFEGGAQGEHKMARGLMPVRTASAHWLAHPAFEQAIADFLAREGRGIEAYVNELQDHSPFKANAASQGGAAEAITDP